MTSKTGTYYQQGDVLIHRIAALPKGLKETKPKGGHYVLAEGEATGHAHAISDLEHCTVYSAPDGSLYLAVEAPVEITHEEHHAQTIPPGTYRVGKVREVDPFANAIRQVRD